MRVLFLVDPDRLFIPNVISEIFKYHLDKFRCVGVGIVKLKYEGCSPAIRHFIKKINVFGFMGLLMVSIWLVRKMALKMVTKRDRYACSTKEVCNNYGIDWFLIDDVNRNASIDLLKRKDPDIIVSMQPQIFGGRLLQLPKIGCINKHAALLPKYRGVWPIFWALLNGEDRVGVTIHWMSTGIDEGGIICQKEIPISDNDTLYSLYEKAFLECPKLICEALDKIQKDPSYGKENVKHSDAYYSFPKWRDHLAFIGKGNKVI